MNTTNANKEEKAITVADLWRVFLTALPLMIVAAVLIVGIGYAYRKVTYHPEYTSKGSFFVLRDVERVDDQGKKTDVLYSEASLAIGMTQSFQAVATSEYVYNHTAAKLNEAGHQISSAQVKSSISVTVVEKSIVVPVYATAYTTDDAEELLAVFMETTIDRVNELFRMENEKTFVSYCDYPSDATLSSSFGTFKIVLIGILGALVVYGVYLILDILDDRIRTGEDISDVAGLTLLGIIPDANSSDRKYSYKYGRKYARQYIGGASDTEKKEG